MSAIFAALIVAAVIGLLAFLVHRSEVLGRTLHPFGKVVVTVFVMLAIASSVSLLPNAGARGGRALSIDVAEAN